MAGAKSSALEEILTKDIVDLLGIADAPKEKQDEIRNKLQYALEVRVFKRLTAELQKLGLFDEFQKLSEDKDMEKFLEDKGVNVKQIILEEGLIFKSQLKISVDMLDAGLTPKANKE